MRVFVTILSIIILLGACQEQPRGDRFEPSGLNSSFDFDISQDFAVYVEYSKNFLKQAGKSEKSIEFNAPFILHPSKECQNPSKKGIVLVHGLLSSPYSMHDLAGHLQKKCFTIYSVLLTGHATRPGDLLHVSYKDWVKQVEYAGSELAKNVDEVYVGGYSIGATLATLYALKHNEVKGIIALSPAYAIEKTAFFANYLKNIYPWLVVHDDEDIVKYESFPTNAAAQAYLLVRKLREQGSKFNGKFFAAISSNDHTINAKGSLDYIDKTMGRNNRKVIIYKRRQDRLEAKYANAPGVFIQDSTIPEKFILDMAHIAIPYSPDNKWYGANGQYRDCLHYEKNSPNHELCKNAKVITRSEIDPNVMRDVQLIRLSYNPFFDAMLGLLDEFLGK